MIPTLAPAALASADVVAPTAGTGQLVVAAVLGIAAIVVLISWLKIHPFLALTLGSVTMALVSGLPLLESFDAFTSGFGKTMSGVGLLVALGAVIGTFLIASGGADAIVDFVLARTPTRWLPWALALVAFVIGIPLFFEVGVVILIPVVMIAARRARLPVIALGIPALAGLSALHALVPPHPGPLIAIEALGANLGLTLGLGLLVAIPTVIVSGPLLAIPMRRWVPIPAPDTFDRGPELAPGTRRPGVGISLVVVLLPVALMLARTLAETLGFEESGLGQALVFVGTPLVALLITTLLALVVLGSQLGLDRSAIGDRVGSSFGPIAGILLIVGAGGGFKETLVLSGIGDVIADGITQAGIPTLVAGWLVAVLIRLATGSATVATTTAAGIMVPLAGGLTDTHTALLVLAIGAGSVFLSHVNDAGFWLVKEFFGMTVGQTFKTWSLMETVLSVVSLVCVLLLSLVL
ncbi:GntP family permease [Kineococcus gynurae]|uniref:GntP family permease n=1 Tax=Kineococcus gynurae TaxID=452979 RepID=A0ABV5LRW6_9ACTN